MTEDEHFLTCLAEECTEVGQRVAKALRFGLAEVQAGQPLTNAERIVEELRDLLAVTVILSDRGLIPAAYVTTDTIRAKEAKIRKFMAISRQHGVLIAAKTEA